RAHRRAEVGFMLAPAHWGKGYAAEAVRAVLRFAFEAMDLHRVEADVDPDNGASLRLLERLGFRREGYLRERWWPYGAPADSVVLGLLRDAFVAEPSAAPARASESDPFPEAAPYEAGLPPLRTERLRLRALTPADDPAIQTLFSDEVALRTWV